jgi:hypothetical protein
MPGKENNAQNNACAEAILACFEALYRTAFRLTGNKAQVEDWFRRLTCVLGGRFLSFMGFRAFSLGCFEFCERCSLIN